VIGDPTSQPKPGEAAERAVNAAAVHPCEAAILEVVRLTLELTSANHTLDYRNGARRRDDLERALAHAQVLTEALPLGSTRSTALAWFAALRMLAEHQLVIAPRPSPAAIAGANAGDGSIYWQEADDWAAVRFGGGLSRPRPRRRTRTDTRPGTPAALRGEPDARRARAQSEANDRGEEDPR
jgi:hypothetical protein